MQFLYRTPKEYKALRNLDVVGQWYKYTGYYLAKMRDIPQEEAVDFLHWAVDNQHINYKDPIMKAFRRDEQSDRYKDTIYLSEYLKEVVDNRLIMAPTLTCYAATEDQPSELSDYTEVKYYERASTKKAGQAAKALGDIDTAITKNNVQNKLKEDINSISGLFTIGSTALANRSGHSTLTSVCRTATAFTNANTERVFMGRRHFFNGPSVLENITVILAEIDYEEGEKLLQKYGLAYITEDQLFEAIKYNTDTYYKSKYWDRVIMNYIQKLTPLERTLYLYVGSLYHVRLYNEQFIRSFFDRILDYKDLSPVTAEETQAAIKKIDDFFLPLASVCCAEFLGGRSIKDNIHYDKEYYGSIGARVIHITKIFEEMQDFIKFFFLNIFIPAETAHFPSAVRYSVVGGDTDSVLYTVMQWVQWYNGTTEVTPVTRLTGSICVYFINTVTRHFLAVAAGQMGLAEKYIHELEMKSEFYFDVFAPTNRTKHYLSIASIQEGTVLRELEEELKGVALKNSKAPPELIRYFHDEAIGILEKVAKGELIEVQELIQRVAEEESKIFTSIITGQSDFLATCTVKVKEAYNIPMSSEYLYYEFWNDILADKYGPCPAPPYIGVRIKMNLPNPTAVKLFGKSIKDSDIRERFETFMEKHNKKAIASIIMPDDVIANMGIPEEFMPALDIRKMIFSVMEPFYILLEVLGNYRVNRWNTNMILDEHLELIPEKWQATWLQEHDTSLDEIHRSTRGQRAEYEEWDTKSSYDEEDDEEEDDNNEDEE